VKTAKAQVRHYALMQVLFTLVFVAVLFGGLEIAARIRQYHKLGPKSLHPMALRDPFTAYRLNPAYGRNDRQHDAEGFRRDKDVSLVKLPNTVHIFLTGGSTAYGYATNMPEDIDNRWRLLYNNETIDCYLEEQLNQAFLSKHWEVINAAAPAYQMSKELAQIESVLLRYRPDYVILVEDGKSGLLVPPLSPSALADAIQKLAQDDELRCSVARNGFECGRLDFSADHSTDNLLRVFEWM